MKIRSAALTGVILLADIVACGPAPESAKGERVSKAIDIVLRVTKDDAQILASLASKPARVHNLRPPAVTATNWTGFKPRTEELVAEFLTRDGKRLTSYGFAARRLRFDDHLLGRMKGREPDEHRPASFPRRTAGPRHDDRFITLPLPEQAAALAIYRTTVLPGLADPRPTGKPGGQLLGVVSAEKTAFGPTHAIRTLLSFHVLEPFPAQDESVCPPWPPAPDPDQDLVPAKIIIDMDRIRKLGTHEVNTKNLPCRKTPECRNGTIQGNKTIWPASGTADPESRFDVVIVGDGFAADEMDKYHDAAEAFQERLLQLEPFANHADKIAIHRVDVVSDESGLSLATASKKTYFGVWGEFYNVTLEMPCPCELWRAAGWVSAWEHLEVFVVIGNSTGFGGRAQPEQRLAMFSVQPNHDQAFEVARHEIAHALNGAMEEDIRNHAWECPCRSEFHAHCNVATQAQVDDDSVWWWDLADPAEQDGNGFKAVHAYGDPATGTCDCNPTFNADAALPDEEKLFDNVGLFWGAHFIDFEVAQDCVCEWEYDIPECCSTQDWDGCSRYNHKLGKGFYRPMASCIMRFLDEEEYCAVCRHEIEQAILNRTWGPSDKCCQGMGLVGIADGC
jgi:hypothetical protein